MSLVSVIFLICLTVGIACLVYIRLKERRLIEQVTSISRGEWSERRVVLKLLKLGINPKAIFHDLYIQKPNGEYTQVDVVVATKAGIIVFEVKDYSGWIFGNEHQKYWTQLLAYGKERHRFYNPVMQMPDILKLLGNVCHKIPMFQFIQSSFSLGIVNLRMLLAMPIILSLYILVLSSE